MAESFSVGILLGGFAILVVLVLLFSLVVDVIVSRFGGKRDD
jgi:hypothetical protein